MAEVGGRLQSGVYRLSALRNNQNGAMCNGRAPGPLPITCTCSVKEEPAQDECQARPKARTAARQRVCQRKQDETSERESPRFIGFFETMQSHQTAAYIPDRLPVLQEKLLSGRMTLWTREALSFNPDTFRSPQQLRAFSSIILLPAGRRSEKPRCGESVKFLRLFHNSSATGRSHSWGSDSGSTDVPLLHRSRTAYYDVLKVSPGATQSQIKSAYYKQSFIYHPDKNPGSKEATKCFSEITEAYSVLGNIGLRRKYDRGILGHSDVQSAGRPSSKEATVTPTGPSQQQQGARRVSRPGGKIMYDFDGFYQAHYGAQLQKEREMRARKEQMREMQKQQLDREQKDKMVHVAVSVLLVLGGLVFINIAKS
ncbi:dnaJ (Hsp40) homolog, subfamily C, member 30b [Betta splendens]|uniref:DnaJ (Hsp40) homolog, subfamily C, member 30b n=1 Tax=Betta splendens TaxID=158456 RepID=A0A6P7PGD0_BETSP|nr:dnaJ (Hsp40) homolog, subfamily C, member 30b [Betta splendens]